MLHEPFVDAAHVELVPAANNQSTQLSVDEFGEANCALWRAPAIRYPSVEHIDREGGDGDPIKPIRLGRRRQPGRPPTATAPTGRVWVEVVEVAEEDDGEES